MGTLTSSDQTGYMHFDQPGLVGGLHVGYALLPWLDARLGATGGGFSSSSRSTGGLLAPVTGLLVHFTGLDVTPVASFDLGVGITGKLVRPFFTTAVGVDFALGPSYALGPVLGYGRVVQTNGIGDSSDASYVFIGLCLSYRAAQVARATEHLRPTLPSTRSDPPPTSRPTPAPSEAPAPLSEPSAALIELIEQAVPTEKHQIELLAPVLFKFDSDALEPIGVAMLHEVAHLLAERSDLELIEVQGYADQRGSVEYNRELSDRRARRVVAWLVEHGVEEARLSVAAQGVSSPVETGTTEEAHEQNRRVVFRVLRTRDP